MTDQTTDPSKTKPGGVNARDHAAHALEKIREVARGNGPHTEREIGVISYDEQIITFPVHLTFRSDMKIQQETVDTPPKGAQKVESRSELTERAEADFKKAGHEDTMKLLQQKIMMREDKGFFCESEEIPLNDKPHQYHYMEKCPECGGKAQVNCKSCNGRGWIKCPECHGKTQITCHECNGNKTIPAPNGGQQQCPKCHGEGFKQCHKCKGQGETQCKKCASKGKKSCSKCNGQGALHHVASATAQAVCSFDRDKDNIPDNADEYIRRLKGRLIEKGHARINQQTVRITQPESGDPGGDSEKLGTLHYDVTLPFGDLKFYVGQEEYDGHIFGYKSALVDIPPFLEQYMLGPMNNLREAAKGNGNVAGRIVEVVNGSRFGRQSIEGIVSHGAKKTASVMKSRFGLGLETEFIDHFVKAGQQALGRVTRKPFIVGSALGVGAALLFYIFYIFGLGALAEQAFPVRIIADFIAIGIGVALPLVLIFVFVSQAMKQSLGTVLETEVKTPKFGQKKYIAPAVSCVLFLVFCEVAFSLNSGAAPLIYSLFRGGLTGG